jgi:hypothetical protein
MTKICAFFSKLFFEKRKLKLAATELCEPDEALAKSGPISSVPEIT